MSVVPHSTAGWHAGFLSVLPAVRTHAKIRFRRLRPEQREDAIQEAIASACVSYQLLAAKGRLHAAHAGMLATFAVNFVNNGRHVGGHQDAARDAMSSVAQSRHRFKTSSYDLFDREAGEWRQMAIADRNASVPDVACFRVDFERWLGTLTRRDRRIIAALLGGEGTGGVAGRFSISSGRVSQLRRKYEQLWYTFQREADAKAA